MTDTQNIIEQLKLKDASTFETVFDEYCVELCGYANKYVEDSDVSEELVQGLFCSLWEKLESIDVRTNLKSLLTIRMLLKGTHIRRICS